ncbi:mitotic-spindle organizing protein 1 [Cryptomeria japonica]|uniref:mitotic-spindle organizing protein 1 n=1 Tax=Cryptomeria japonica TaxID=3369 RepID=UPI0027D9D622|nr:mitotic-spindle organizing protein 1 [Cryptomeria japonica]XP_057853841.2 mitotic-spindle organizing protein 1 [Cryptomeria japonica]XP_057853842.2 mitotic-spindle organizing protein 1 [Cryptomeria japonica]XP_057853844.2 mitotic-spindle organizing protein 1 [Cryptomeria japonica]XP_057853846.2 mitotic-spindle organizing protein 1 [Cryptomeria japonica]XP_057853847.2 mitotic-spindle organizing protein 1 [Cryptomeria japonica]XP_057853849.2 mitotic-spindle organizing protein 1 [Cryptomeria 
MDRGSAQKARESLDLVFSMSNFLQTGLDRHSLAILIALTEQGVNPEALAAVVKELRREAAAINQHSSSSS